MGQNIERKLQNNFPFQRTNFLLRSLSQIEKRERNIQNSHMNSFVKSRFLAILERNRALILARIDAITQTGGTTDTLPPVISSLTVSNITMNHAVLSATLDESGIGYFVVLPSGSVAPSAVQIQAGQDSSSTMTPLR